MDNCRVPLAKLVFAIPQFTPSRIWRPPKANQKFLLALRGKLDFDPDNALRGTAIEFFGYSTFIRLQSAPDTLSRRTTMFLEASIGEFFTLICQIPSQLATPRILSHLGKELGVFRPSGHLNELANAALKFAMRHFSKMPIRHAVVRFWVRQVRSHQQPRQDWTDIRPDGLSEKKLTSLCEDAYQSNSADAGSRCAEIPMVSTSSTASRSWMGLTRNVPSRQTRAENMGRTCDTALFSSRAPAISSRVQKLTELVPSFKRVSP